MFSGSATPKHRGPHLQSRVLADTAAKGRCRHRGQAGDDVAVGHASRHGAHAHRHVGRRVLEARRARSRRVQPAGEALAVQLCCALGAQVGRRHHGEALRVAARVHVAQEARCVGVRALVGEVACGQREVVVDLAPPKRDRRQRCGVNGAEHHVVHDVAAVGIAAAGHQRSVQHGVQSAPHRTSFAGWTSPLSHRCMGGRRRVW